jgi:hypothetical protein
MSSCHRLHTRHRVRHRAITRGPHHQHVQEKQVSGASEEDSGGYYQPNYQDAHHQKAGAVAVRLETPKDLQALQWINAALSDPEVLNLGTLVHGTSDVLALAPQPPTQHNKLRTVQALVHPRTVDKGIGMNNRQACFGSFFTAKFQMCGVWCRFAG